MGDWFRVLFGILRIFRCVVCGLIRLYASFDEAKTEGWKKTDKGLLCGLCGRD